MIVMTKPSAGNAPAAKCGGPSSRDGREARASVRGGACRECGATFCAQRYGQEFCGPGCRRSFHNRKARRGAQLYDLMMALRFERPRPKELGAWSLLCRFAAACKAADDRERAGRRSWDGIDRVRSRNAHLLSTIVGTVAGRRRVQAANLQLESRNIGKVRMARGQR